jgi:outer membrane protein TolC
MKLTRIRRLFIIGLFQIVTLSLLAQEPSTTKKYSLQEAVEYALQNNINIKNAESDVTSAQARVGEIRAIGLPQINAEAQLIHNFKIQTQFVPENAFSPVDAQGKPTSGDEVVGLAFGVNNMGMASITASQLIFDGSYFIGLKAASTYKQLSQKSLNQSKISVKESVTKAYYSVLVNRERLALLDINIGRLDSLLRETKAMNQSGFVEKIDVDRIEVQFNNLQTERQKVDRLVELSEALLKFQMGHKVNEPIILSDKLASPDLENFSVPATSNFDYSQRVEYSLLQTQKELATLDIKNSKAGYYPRLAAFGTFGYNTGSMKFDLYERRWYDYSNIGLSLSIPIFDGFQKSYKIQQARLTQEKAVRSTELLQNSIDLEIRQSSVTLTNAVESLKSQKRNLELAQEVARVTRIKYQQGVGSNIEVINAEASYKEAQTNYYSALYDAIVAKVDYDKATGKLLAE